MTAKLTGMEQVLKNINAEVAKVEGRTVGGLLALGNVVLGRSNRKVPREIGNLIGSGYARKAQHNPKAVEVGYTSAYALHVHESVGMKLRGKPRPKRKGEGKGLVSSVAVVAGLRHVDSLDHRL
jgi:hypothetical protein